MTENLLNSARNPQPVWKRKLKQAGRAIQSWLRELIRSMIEIIILFAVTAVLTGILLSLLEPFGTSTSKPQSALNIPRILPDYRRTC
jgi:hypothetical protein